MAEAPGVGLEAARVGDALGLLLPEAGVDGLAVGALDGWVAAGGGTVLLPPCVSAAPAHAAINPADSTKTNKAT